MKNLFLLLIAVLLVSACSQQIKTDEPMVDPMNGYGKYLKCGEQVRTLWAGQYIEIGTVTYGIEGTDFYAKYDCGLSGWTISETNLFAGDKKDMPKNKPGAPKVGNFPYKGTHNPWVSTYTYYIPLDALPPCASPGFVVAAHAVVHGPGNQEETAWAEGTVATMTFSDKGWGWYDIYYFNQPPNEYTILYATAFVNDSLKLYHLDVTNGTTTLILGEALGEDAGRSDAAAYDVESGMFYFASYATDVLYGNQLKDDGPSYAVGTLMGKAASATFFDGEYYYIDENDNSINKVSFNVANNTYSIASDIPLDTIPSSIVVNDIAMNPEGTTMYMIGEVNGGTRQLITWDVATETFFTTSLTVTSGAQLTYGSDGTLYVIAAVVEGDSHSLMYSLDPNSGTLTPVDDDTYNPDDPFSDISMGPIM